MSKVDTFEMIFVKDEDSRVEWGVGYSDCVLSRVVGLVSLRMRLNEDLKEVFVGNDFDVTGVFKC